MVCINRARASCHFRLSVTSSSESKSPAVKLQHALCIVISPHTNQHRGRRNLRCASSPVIGWNPTLTRGAFRQELPNVPTSTQLKFLCSSSSWIWKNLLSSNIYMHRSNNWAMITFGALSGDHVTSSSPLLVFPRSRKAKHLTCSKIQCETKRIWTGHIRFVYGDTFNDSLDISLSWLRA